MSRSYQADEKVFQKLRAAGKMSWDEQADPDQSQRTMEQKDPRKPMLLQIRANQRAR